MKKTIIALSAVLIIILAFPILVIVTESKIQRTMEKEILSHVDAISFSEFKSSSTTLLKDEIKDSLLYYRMKISWDECFLDLYKNIYDEPVKVEYYQDQLVKDVGQWDYLNGLKDNYDSWNAIRFHTYTINYLYIDEYGNRKVEMFYATFDKDDKLVAYRLNTQSEWVNVMT